MKHVPNAPPGIQPSPTLVELLQARSARDGGDRAYTFLADGEREAESLTYQELDCRARWIAASLRARVRPGDRALLVYGAGLEFVAAFFGCLYAGVIAVPVYPPRTSGLTRFLSVLDNCGAIAALTTSDISRQLAPLIAQNEKLNSLFWFATEQDAEAKDKDRAALIAGWQQPAPALDSIAFLQYTSGSTSTPKGVMINHASLVRHLDVIERAYGGLSGQETFLTWLPVYHDMGLIGNVLQSVYMSSHCVLMSPVAFIQNPLRWLNAISQYKGTVSGGPNFGYDLCLQKISAEEREKLDLRSWRIAFNGAEPVRCDTLEQFARTFAPCGFRKEALRPSYGMAEAILMVSCGREEEFRCKAFENAALEQNRAVEVPMTPEMSQKSARVLSSCGSGFPEQKMLIVDPDTLKSLPALRVGEIWIANPSLAQGYWNRPEETQHTFQAYLADTGEGPFLRTGDLGFLEAEGDLYIAGRLKDLIIINGRNHYPQDIELTVERCNAGFRSTGGAAFSAEIEGEERLIIVQEVKRTYLNKLDVDAAIEDVRIALANHHEVEAYAVELVKPGSIPKTSSGKLQRRLCREKFLTGGLETLSRRKAAIFIASEAAKPQPDDSLWDAKASDNRELLRWSRQIITAVIAEATLTPAKAIDPTRNFLSLGISSVKAINIIASLEASFGVKLPPSLLFEFPTIAQFVEYLVRNHKTKLMVQRGVASGQEQTLSARPDAHPPEMMPASFTASGDTAPRNRHDSEDGIAVIGLACRLPGAAGPAEFWDLLVNGRDVVTEVPEDHWDWRTVFDSNPDAENKTYSRWGGFLKDISMFDAAFFGISPREAKLMDPQQRLFLEVAWEALEDAGYPPESLAGQPVGVFAGSSYNGYYQKIRSSLKQSDHSAGVANHNAVIANRVSFAFNFQGPSILVDTLCSSSLVALHFACQSVKSGESSIALAGGVNILLSPENYVGLSRMKAHSPDGRCKPFDHRANGIVFGEGAGVVLLKPLRAALRDKDNIRAVIRGTATNHGGLANGLLAPNPYAQAQVVRQAIEAADISSRSISYVEAHGTGTALGDPIEIEGLTKAFQRDTSERQFCRIGSVKSNIGHLEAAAGIAGVIKVILAMQHGQLPPTLHFEKANPQLDLEQSPFAVNTELLEWRSEGPRRAGISSFGVGGSNAHVVIEEPPAIESEAAGAQRPGHVITLSGRSKPALDAKARLYSEFLQKSPQVDLGDLSFTSNAGRSHFQHRLAITVDSVPALQEKLHAFRSGQTVEGVFAGQVETGEPPEIAFLFAGVGSQHAGMARRLYETESTFRAAMDRCQSLARTWLKEPLLDLLFSPSAEERLSFDPLLTQLSLFSIEVALVELWRSWGVVPDIVMGHSLGEFAAAYVAGVFTLEEGMKLVAERARLILTHSKAGAMAVIYATEDVVQENLQSWKEQISIAAFNGPQNIVISGEETAVKSMVQAMTEKNIECEHLKVRQAFHSLLLDPVLEPFEQVASGVSFRAPRIPLVSNVTGRIFETGSVQGSHYWRRQMREPVRFVDSIRAVAEQGCNVFLEIGPSASMVSLARRCLAIKHTGVASLAAGQDDWSVLLSAVAKLYARGVRIDWAGFDASFQRRKISLPTYPFQRRYFWLEAGRPEGRADHGAEGEKPAHPAYTDAPRADQAPPASTDGVRIAATRKESIVAFLRNALARFLEMDESEIDNHRSLLEMGSDSLVFIEAIQAIQQAFSIKITVRQLFEELATLELLANYLDHNLPPEAKFAGWPAAAQSSPAPQSHDRGAVVTSPMPTGIPQITSPAVTIQPGEVTGSMERIMVQQLAAMQQLVEQQLAVLRESGARPQMVAPAQATPAAGPQQALATAADRVDNTIGAMQPWVPYQPWNPGSMEELPQQQQVYLKRFVASYAERTRESKRLTQEHRGHHADLRSAMSFRLCTKEIRYPIIGVRSDGPQMWDVDGNSYVDFAMGYGVNLFGHNPPFVIQALKDQMEKGIHVGPQSELAGEVAALICEMTGVERVTFANTGTEAVMAAMRVARTSTGRKKIAIFAGSYHGTSDSVLVSARMVDGHLQAVPMVPGLPPGMVEDMVVLHYGSAHSLEILEKNAEQFAAVLVEPVQSRKPDLQPSKFLHQLRQITKRAGVLLIFDETITGFRVHQRGAQGWFNVEADLCTYGKVVGGGMPIGVLAGRAEVMNAIDGGLWQFGDASVPGAQTTLYTGTFCKHPLAMAAARATLLEIKRLGPGLFTELTDRTTSLVRRLNECCREAGAPIEVVQFGSLFRLGGPLQMFSADALDLLYYHLIHQGVYVWEGRNWFLSTAHTAEDLDYTVTVMKKTLHDMREAGFLSGPGLVANQTRAAFGSTGDLQPRADQPRPNGDVQKDLFLLSQADKVASLSFNESAAVRLRGPIEMRALQLALEKVASRHESLRTVFSEDGETNRVLPVVTVEIEEHELTGDEAAEQEWLEKEAQTPFELVQKPLWRVRVLKSGLENHLLVIIVHHLIADGWSIGVLLNEIASCYCAAVEQRQTALPAPLQFQDYQSFFNREFAGPRMALAETYWLEKLKDAPVWSLPLDYPRAHSYGGGRVKTVLDPALQSQWTALSTKLGATPAMTFLSAYQFLLAQVSGQRDLMVVMPVAGQAQMNGAQLMGDCSNLMAVRSILTEDLTFAECVKATKRYLLDSDEHQLYPLASLVRKLGPMQDPGRWPFFNIDRPLSMARFSGLTMEGVLIPLLYTHFDLGLNITIFGGRIMLAFEYRTALFDKTTIEQWSASFIELLLKIVADPDLRVRSLPAPAQRTLPAAMAAAGDENPSFAYVAPSTPVEEVLTSIWEQVLNLKRISVTTSFFDLGGHSLLATQIISRVREIFGVQVSLAPMFLEPTIAEFSRHLELAIKTGAGQREEKLLPVGRDRDLLLSFPQRRLWLIDQLEPGNAAYNVVGAARLTGVLDMPALEAAFAELVRRQESLRTVFLATEGEPIQRIMPAQPLHFEHVDLSSVTESAVSETILREGQAFTRAPFHLSTGPLIRVRVLRFGEKDHAVIVVVHHIVSDGWSMGILLGEVGLLYSSAVAGKPSGLRDLPVQFADYAAWQRSSQGEVLQRQLDYWLTHLQGVPSFLNLPVDHPRLATPSFRGAHEPLAFTQKSTELLRQFCRLEGISPFMALLAVFSLLLSRYSGQDDFVIGTDIANRNRLEIEDLVGCFVNLLPLRMDLSGDITFREYIQHIRKLTLNAYMHQEVPFDQLIRALRPERKMTSTPLVQVLFVLQNAPLPALETGELHMELVPIYMETAEFELILSIDDAPGAFTGAVGYSTDLFNRERIVAMISHLQTLVDQVVSTPEQRLSAFSLLSAKESTEFPDAGLSQKDLNKLLLRLAAKSNS